MRHCYLLLCLLLCSHAAMAQQDKIVVHFTDATKEAALPAVRITDPAGQQLAATDNGGYAVLPLASFTTYPYLLALCPGYKPDTLHSPSLNVYLQPLSVVLSDAVVSSRKVKQLSASPNEYVADYAFIGNYILVASYSGNGGKKAKLHLLTKDGDEAIKCSIPDHPVRLYKSCVGNYYCVYEDRFYPILIDHGKMNLEKPYRINMLAGLQECELAMDNNFYYRIADKMSFRMTYGMIRKGDTVFKPLVKMEYKKVAEASFEEYLEILYFLDKWQFHEAARLQRQRSMWDRGAYCHLDIPLFSKGDSLIVFDYEHKLIRYYSSTGDPIGTTPVQFDWRSAQRFDIIKDDVTEQCYIHRWSNQSAQTLEELNINTGTVSDHKITIDHPLAEQVRVHNGSIYYLWQDSHASAPRQLYVQGMN